MRSINSLPGVLNETVTFSQPATPVLPVTDHYTEFLYGFVNGATTGFCGGYTSSAQSDYASVMPGLSAGQFTPLPPDTVGTTGETVRIASSSTQDGPTGTGCSGYIIFYLDLTYALRTEIVFLNGTTPVTLLGLSTVPAQHFLYGFPIAKGLAVTPPGNVIGNVGTIWLGVGATFSGTTGFSTKNYMWNRPRDGFISSAVYCVPRGVQATLWSVKFNSSRSAAVAFQTLFRVNRASPWQLLAEDVVSDTAVIQRSIAGGFYSTGAEFTCIAKRTEGTAATECNFVLTAHELKPQVYRPATF